MELIPGSQEYVDKKTFTWDIEEFNESQMSIKLEFDNKLYISNDDLIDQMKISFNNTDIYMKP